MSERGDIEAALEQMEFEVVDNGIIECPTSKPATFEFAEESEYNPEGFESEVESHGFSLIGPHTNLREDGEFYYYVDVMTDHYKEVSVKVWADSANIYPKEELPDTYELARIIHAIEDGFGAELTHDA